MNQKEGNFHETFILIFLWYEKHTSLGRATKVDDCGIFLEDLLGCDLGLLTTEV